jgi:hypothetical protein
MNQNRCNIVFYEILLKTHLIRENIEAYFTFTLRQKQNNHKYWTEHINKGMSYSSKLDHEVGGEEAC